MTSSRDASRALPQHCVGLATAGTAVLVLAVALAFFVPWPSFVADESTLTQSALPRNETWHKEQMTNSSTAVNAAQLMSSTQALVSQPFFRYFKTSLYEECPFFAENHLCMSPDCGVDSCPDNNVPQQIKECHDSDRCVFVVRKRGSESGSPQPEKEAAAPASPDAMQESIGSGDSGIGVQPWECIAARINWTIPQDAVSQLLEGPPTALFEAACQEDKERTTSTGKEATSNRQCLVRVTDEFCDLDTLASSEYIDLLANPEQYTGFRAPESHRIWTEIYSQNCFGTSSESSASANDREFSHEDDLDDPLASLFSQGEGLDDMTMVQPSVPHVDADGLCQETALLFRLVSGIHTSISLHLCQKWLDPSTGQRFANVDEFLRRFSSEATDGLGPGWLSNLDYAFGFVASAILKSRSLWEKYPFSDPDTAGRVNQLLSKLDLASQAQALNQSDSVGESALPKLNVVDPEALFRGRDGRKLFLEAKEAVLRMNRVMDCVGCMKCRLWGKLQNAQFRGLAAALKLMFADVHGASFQGSSSGQQRTTVEFRPTHSAAPHTRSLQTLVTLNHNDVIALFNLLERLTSSLVYRSEFLLQAQAA